MTAAVPAELAPSYERCRALHRAYGRSEYLATRLLPAWKRPHVHALYGFARYTDEIVDHTGAETTVARAERLRDWIDRFAAALSGAPVVDPILPALLHTIDVFDLDRSDFTAFLRSMAMDLTVTEYGSTCRGRISRGPASPGTTYARNAPPNRSGR